MEAQPSDRVDFVMEIDMTVDLNGVPVEEFVQAVQEEVVVAVGNGLLTAHNDAELVKANVDVFSAGDRYGPIDDLPWDNYPKPKFQPAWPAPGTLNHLTFILTNPHRTPENKLRDLDDAMILVLSAHDAVSNARYGTDIPVTASPLSDAAQDVVEALGVEYCRATVDDSGAL